MKYGKYGNKRNLLKSALSSWVLLVAGIVVFIILLRAAWGIHEKSVLSRTKLSQARSELAKLGSRESSLESEVTRLSTDQGVEAEIRTKYKGVRDGESVAVIIGDDATATDESATSTESLSTASVGWFRKLLQMVGL